MKTYTRFLPIKVCIGVCTLALGFAGTATAGLQENLDNCYSCHGKDGVSTKADIPTIGGFSAIYITDSMTTFRNKERPCEETEIVSGPHKGDKTDMCAVAKDLSEADTEKVADHLATLPFVRTKQPFDAEKAKLGKITHNRECKKCHEDGGSSPDDDAGILAGQHMKYTQEQLEEYATGKRPMPEKMKVKFEKLEQADLENLTNFYGSFQ
jgi:cytochrome subunit of sulfide dehydrogenase